MRKVELILEIQLNVFFSLYCRSKLLKFKIMCDMKRKSYLGCSQFYLEVSLLAILFSSVLLMHGLKKHTNETKEQNSRTKFSTLSTGLF